MCAFFRNSAWTVPLIEVVSLAACQQTRELDVESEIYFRNYYY